MKPVDSIYQKLLDPNSIYGYLNKVYKDVENVILKACEDNTSESLIICGPCGSGKSKIIKKLEEFIINNVKDSKFIVIEGCVQTAQSAPRELLSYFTDHILEDESTSSILHKLASILQSSTNRNYIVLNDIEYLCSLKNQQFLYMLFDTVFSAAKTLFVIGTTRAGDIVERFEKRVLSRFSQSIYLTFNTDSFDNYYLIIEEILNIPRKSSWKELIKACLTKDVQKNFQRLYNIDNNVGTLINIIVQVINSEPKNLSENHFISTIQNYLASQRKIYLSGLIEVEVFMLLVVVQHLRDKIEKTFQKHAILEKCREFYDSIGHMNVSYSSLGKAFESLVYNKIFASESKLERYIWNKNYILMYSENEISLAIQNRNDLPNYVKVFFNS